MSPAPPPNYQQLVPNCTQYTPLYQLLVTHCTQYTQLCHYNTHWLTVKTVKLLKPHFTLSVQFSLYCQHSFILWVFTSSIIGKFVKLSVIGAVKWNEYQHISMVPHKISNSCQFCCKQTGQVILHQCCVLWSSVCHCVVDFSKSTLQSIMDCEECCILHNNMCAIYCRVL